jgi:predicted Ser/Thr protein kinase
MEFDNLLELIEKTTSEKLSHAKPVEATKPEPKKKFISPSAPQLKKQYEEVLKKNIVPIIAHLEEEKKRYLASVHAYMKLNTTSVFTYRFDEATGEITGSIEGCASIKIPFKS